MRTVEFRHAVPFQHVFYLQSALPGQIHRLMKAFLQRLRVGGGTKDKDAAPQPKEKFPPLRTWPPEESQRATPTPTSLTSFKPLPELVPEHLSAQLSPRPLHPTQEPSTSHSTLSTPTPSSPTPTPPVSDTRHDDASAEDVARATTPRAEPDSAGRSSRKTANGSLNTPATSDNHKKVAFISPPGTPATLDRALPDAPGNATPAPPMKTTVSRFQATHGKEPRGSTSTASSSKVDVASTHKGNSSAKAASTRTASPYRGNGDVGSLPSLRSGTPYSQMSNNSGSRILAATSWSEVTEEDLVSNLGSRERTRQEVLFEIISSEER